MLNILKNHKKRMLLLSLTMMLNLSANNALAAPSVTITGPSDSFNNKYTISPRRDFIVRGSLSGLNDTPTNIQVVIKNGVGTIVRTVTSRVNAQGYTPPATIDVSGIGTSSSDIRWTTDSEALKNNPSPDLVMTPLDGPPISTVKAVVNRQGQYAALILGGLDSGSGFPGLGPDLTEGNYTITVNALDLSNNVLATATRDLSISPGDLICARFSPKETDGYPHLENVTRFAADNNLKILLDPLPGYWSQDATPTSGEVFYENRKLWRTNDLAEYLAAPNTAVVIYNINDNSTTQSLEIGGLIKNNRLQDETPGHKVYFYRYDIGDINVGYTRSDSSTVTATGKIVDFDGTHSSKHYKQLAMARAERRDDGQYTTENLIDFNDTKLTIDTNVTDGIYLKPFQNLSLIGAVTPIATSNVEYNNTSETYTVNDKISKIRYVIDDPRNKRKTIERDVGLTRQYSPTWSAPSIYEFKNIFGADLFPKAGVYTVSAQGFDQNGNSVNSATQVFKVTVSTTGLIAPPGTHFTEQQERAGRAMLELHLDSILQGDDPRWINYTAASNKPDATRVLNSLSGRAKATSLTLPSSQYQTIFSHLQITGSTTEERDVWAKIYATKEINDDYDTNNYGTVVGYDQALGSKFTGGIFIAKDKPRLTETNGDRVDADEWQVGIYGSHAVSKHVSLRGFLSYGKLDYDMQRHPLDMISLSSNYSGRSTEAALEAAVNMGRIKTKLNVTPAIGVSYKHTRQDGFRESDPIIGLNFEDASYHETTLYAGARFEQVFSQSKDNHGALSGGLFYNRRLGNGIHTESVRFNGGGTGFDLEGTGASRHSLLAELNYDWHFKNQSISLGYSGEFSGAHKKHQISLGYGFRF